MKKNTIKIFILALFLGLSTANVSYAVMPGEVITYATVRPTDIIGGFCSNPAYYFCYLPDELGEQLYGPNPCSDPGSYTFSSQGMTSPNYYHLYESSNESCGGNINKQRFQVTDTAPSGGGVGTFITIPETATADLLDYAGALFTDLWVVIALVIGIPLAFYVIRKVIGMVRAH